MADKTTSTNHVGLSSLSSAYCNKSSYGRNAGKSGGYGRKNGMYCDDNLSCSDTLLDGLGDWHGGHGYHHNILISSSSPDGHDGYVRISSSSSSHSTYHGKSGCSKGGKRDSVHSHGSRHRLLQQQFLQLQLQIVSSSSWDCDPCVPVVAWRLSQAPRPQWEHL